MAAANGGYAQGAERATMELESVAGQMSEHFDVALRRHQRELLLHFDERLASLDATLRKLSYSDDLMAAVPQEPSPVIVPQVNENDVVLKDIAEGGLGAISSNGSEDSDSEAEQEDSATGVQSIKSEAEGIAAIDRYCSRASVGSEAAEGIKKEMAAKAAANRREHIERMNTVVGPKDDNIVPRTGLSFRQKISRMTQSYRFEVFYGVTIVTNSVLIGVQVEWTARNLNAPVPWVFTVLQQVYAALFFIELVCRVTTEGICFFWRSKDFIWNYLDTFIVAMSLFEIGVLIMRSADEYSAGTSNMRIVRIMKMTRLLRVVRVVKVVRFIRALRCLVYSVMGTMRLLMWSLLLLALIMYVFSILYTDTITGYREEYELGNLPNANHQTVQMLTKRFGHLNLSMHTLFRSISAGLSWDEVMDPLADIHWLWVWLFSIYIAFCSFAVLNVMTGTFCQSAIEGAHRDHDLLVQQMMADKKRHIELIENLFNSIDETSNGAITMLEFENHFEDERVKAFFQSMDLDATDAWSMFSLLDAAGEGTVEASDFVEGCMRLKGPAKGVDIATLLHYSNRMSKNVRKVYERTKNMERNLQLLVSATPVTAFAPRRTDSGLQSLES